MEECEHFSGAPIYPRVRVPIDPLRGIGFGVYGQPFKADRDRILFECFPNEVVWSIGVLGYAPHLNVNSLQLYKRLGKNERRFSKTFLMGSGEHYLYTSHFALTEVDDNHSFSVARPVFPVAGTGRRLQYSDEHWADRKTV